ncbi:MAG: response regulator [Chloroflexi bacterium AL-W]|nr:response regulator [Chloroflexi bacterium AL-N1]NOK68917.1 response regulator [Chloroflexi bacterium AL-N10]NOK76900.1 response regulator [Chloroflexi bacterium AL-N5]NOK82712.1 response regulator [Chloroflexi bacterium AL-W]NOK90757.1 response regulator [Chloroflexi bacterium AL-N15]
MVLHQIAILDKDSTAAWITQRGLQGLLQEEAEVVVMPSFDVMCEYCSQGRVDLAIVDPGPQGRTMSNALKTLRLDYRHIPVLVLTAYDTPHLRSQMRDFTVQEYLAKPLDLREVAHVVRNILGLNTLANMHPRHMTSL